MFDKRDPLMSRDDNCIVRYHWLFKRIPSKSQSWVKNGLIEMEIHPAEQKRLVAALTQQLDHHPRVTGE